MADNRQYDSYEIKSLAIPVVPNLGRLSEQACLVAGQNVYATWGGTTRKRPPLLGLNFLAKVGVFPVRMVIYQTIETTPVTYLVGSFFNGSVYEILYAKVSGVSIPSWSTVTERRGCNHSENPHELIVKRGFVYVKSYPGIIDFLGTVRLDGTGGTMVTHDWGAFGPTSPVALSAPSGWSASAHNVTVNNSWGYVYTYVMFSGQETDQSPLQTNPDSLPSFTGPFTNKLPSMTIVGPADTTEYPFINMYRTTDGGGTFYFLHQVTNTGGSITFVDKFLASGSGNADPIPDTILSTNYVAPTTQSNSPPPAVAPPQVTGVNSPARSTRIVQYSGRLWYAINQYLFYSALEELNAGVPEESWPSGIANPNFFEFPELINQLTVTPNGLLVITASQTLVVNGTTKATFNPRPFIGNVGAANNFQNLAACEAGENVAWMTQDFNVAVVNGQSFAIISYPLGNLFKTLADSGYIFDLKYWKMADKEWLIVGAMNYSGSSMIYVYDLDRSRKSQSDFWNPQWNFSSLGNPTCMCVGFFSTADTENKLVINVYDLTSTIPTKLDYTGNVYPAADMGPSNADIPYNWWFTTSLLPVPPGDHVNLLRVPNLSPVLDNISYERTLFGDASEVDPQMNLYYDDFFTSPHTMSYPPNPVTRRQLPLGYRTLTQNDARSVCRRISINLCSTPGNGIFGQPTDWRAEIHNLALCWLPESGANR